MKLPNPVVAAFVSLSLAGPAPAQTVSYDALQVMRDMGIQIRQPNCRDTCERHELAPGLTPAEFLRADTVDFGGYRLLSLPEWLFDMPNLKHLTLKNSVLSASEFLRLGTLPGLEMLSLENVLVTGWESAYADEMRTPEAIMASVFGRLQNLRELNLARFRVREHYCPHFGRDFVSAGTASRLRALNISCSYAGPIFDYRFSSLETLQAHNSSRLPETYQDLFRLPRLTVLEGLQDNETRRYVAERVARRQAQSQPER